MKELAELWTSVKLQWVWIGLRKRAVWHICCSVLGWQLPHRWAGEGKDVGRGATVCYFAISPVFFHLLTHLPLSYCCKWAKQKLHEVLDVNIAVKPQRRPRSWVLTADSALAPAVPVCTCAVFRCWFGQIVMFIFCNSHHFLNRLVCFQ